RSRGVRPDEKSERISTQRERYGLIKTIESPTRLVHHHCNQRHISCAKLPVGVSLLTKAAAQTPCFQGLPFINSLIDTSPRSLRSTKARIRKSNAWKRSNVIRW
ncbi:hypothetical protein, partial [Pseudomonas syringae]|uniref:hypothetical protein n=1 Tax=Pseudomonas syringae TaxID=317 RepID=UPI001E5FEBE0